MIPKENWPEAPYFLKNEDKEFIISNVLPLFHKWEYGRAYYGLKFAQDFIQRFGIIQLSHLNEP